MEQIEQKRRRKKADPKTIFNWAKKELFKAAELFTRRKSEIILETAKKLEEEAGIDPHKISTEIAHGLDGFVTHDWVLKVLKDYPQYKEQFRVDNVKKRKSSNTNITGSSQTEQSQKQEHESSTVSNTQPVAGRLSNSQRVQAMTTSEGRMGYINEEHECYKDDIIKQLEAENTKFRTFVKKLKEKVDD